MRSVKRLAGYRILATDGEIGTVDGFLFDDVTWTARYMVIDTGNWLARRQLLISPAALGRPDWRARLLPVMLSRAQVEKSPDIDAHPPVSRQQETEVAAYFGWPIYWGAGAGPLSPGIVGAYTEAGEAAAIEAQEPPGGDPHLRSTQEMTGYRVETGEEDAGHIDDFLVDDEDWVIRYLVVDTGTWWPGKKALLVPQSVRNICWDERRLEISLDREALRRSPEYDESALEAA